ncbi:hypothetical protein VKT23_006016 [Stygiomarasmius scandens]|uniref:Uncharacterized protein n=1 Tax=Marasmiellus scandens TaxID=2682957 RepID=A0ABR1JR21_9AGAR
MADGSSSTIILFGALPTDSHINPTVNVPSFSRSITPVGTASDGSETTYLEEVVVYSSGSSAAGASQTALSPISTWAATLVEGASAYAVQISGSNAATFFSCNIDSGECVRSGSRVVGGTPTTSISTISSFSAATSAQTTLLLPVLTTATASSSSTSSESSATLVPDSRSGSNNRSMIGRAVGGAIGGSALLALLCFLFIICYRRRRRSASDFESRSLPQTTSRSLPRSDSSVPPFQPPKPTFAYGQGDNASETYSESELKGSLRPGSLISASASDSRSFLSQDNRMPIVPYANSRARNSPPPATLMEKAYTPTSPSALARELPTSPASMSQEFPSTAPGVIVSPSPRPQRSHSSRFIERLSLNSTKLDVLMALASIESARDRSRGQATSAVSVTSYDSQTETSRGTEHKHSEDREDSSNLDDNTTLQGSSFQDSTLASKRSWEESSVPHSNPHAPSSTSHSGNHAS